MGRKSKQATVAQPEPQVVIAEVTESSVKQPSAKPVTDADRAALKLKHSHVDESTLKVVETGSGLWKRSVVAHLECGHDADLFTSDLHQVKMCHACKAAAKGSKREEQRALTAERKAIRKAEKVAARESAKIERKAA